MSLEDAAAVIESIRRDEFGLDPNTGDFENCLLKKQHARLGRALQCLSQELYSHNSHLLLELVQNADDNKYPDNVEPTLAFILLDSGITVLNNEKGFTVENIRALCDIGKSTKKGTGAGYIGNKGIGFKSVFLVTDAPEIHSYGFHLKFDITQGQIGFVAPTLVPSCDVTLFSNMVATDGNERSCTWNTCISLPFRSELANGSNVYSIVSMFSELHPSLLLFLHRLKCIKFRNMIDDSLLVMRKEAVSNGIVKVLHGSEKVSFLVVRKKIQGTVFRHDVCTTEIAMAFALKETSEEVYEPFLKQQPVFAFLPLRNYGLKFILQGDFGLPSSREEVDGNSAWNQWLLSEFPSLFVSAQNHFCALPCFEGNTGKAVTAFMSFVPLFGEVHGFFSQLPNMIISNLCTTRCLFSEPPESLWVYPCRALRGWDAQARLLIPDDLLQKNLGLCYLSQDIIISDALAASLGIPEYGPKVLVDLMTSLCRTDGCFESLGLGWIGAWLAAFNALLSRQKNSSSEHLYSEILFSLKKLPFFPLSDGSFSSLSDGTIWLQCDFSRSSSEYEYDMKQFPSLNANLRTINPLLMQMSKPYVKEGDRVDDIIEMMLKLGVQKLCAHEVIKCHILPSLSCGTPTYELKSLIIEYLAFIMHHLQSPCTSCSSERESIISEVRIKPILCTNYGFKCAIDEPIHFSKQYGNPVDSHKLFDNMEIKWIELDSDYLRLHRSRKSHFKLKKWRQFFQTLGVTDFVQVVYTERILSHVDSLLLKSMHGELSHKPLIIRDWVSPELISLLSAFSVNPCRQRCICFLEILDKLWDKFYSNKVRIMSSEINNDAKYTDSSFIKILRDTKWIASSMDETLHYAKDLFVPSADLQSLIGSIAPFCVPQICSKLLIKDFGFKTEVTLDDALALLNFWRNLDSPFSASLEQMTRLYNFIFLEVNKPTMKGILSSLPVFVPYVSPRSNMMAPGNFLSPGDVFWEDPTGCSSMLRMLCCEKNSRVRMNMLSVLYPSLRDFFVGICGVRVIPSSFDYLDILLQLAKAARPSQILKPVFLVFQRWGDDIYSGTLGAEDLSRIKDTIHQLSYTILPTMSDKWVSLHPSFDLVCWPDDMELAQHFKNSDGVTLLEVSTALGEEKRFDKIDMLMKALDVQPISEVVSREAISFGGVENSTKALRLINSFLPYIQRYIYKYPDIYANVKHNESKISDLQMVVVKKLHYKYTLRGKNFSTRPFECSSLLQGNVLYATNDADMHPVYMELSRLFFSKCNLQFANFLHMLTIMAQSGTNNQQMEYFIFHSQRIPELPGEESCWCLSSFLEQLKKCEPLPVHTLPEHCSSSSSSHGKKSRKVEHGSSSDSSLRKKFKKVASSQAACPSNASNGCSGVAHAPHEGLSLLEHELKDASPKDAPIQVPDSFCDVRTDENLVIEGGLQPSCSSVLESSRPVDQFLSANADRTSQQAGFLGSSGTHSPDENHSTKEVFLQLTEETRTSDNPDTDEDDCEIPEPMNAENRNTDGESTQLQVSNPGYLNTGTLGEFVAYTYFVKKLGPANVKWVNEEDESGLPYDLVIGDKEDSQEFVEVKATASAKKDSFILTHNEWRFASERGDLFSIAHVVLLAPRTASISVLRNPWKLWQQNVLRFSVAVSIKKQPDESRVILGPESFTGVDFPKRKLGRIRKGKIKEKKTVVRVPRVVRKFFSKKRETKPSTACAPTDQPVIIILD